MEQDASEIVLGAAIAVMTIYMLARVAVANIAKNGCKSALRRWLKLPDPAN